MLTALLIYFCYVNRNTIVVFFLYDRHHYLSLYFCLLSIDAFSLKYPACILSLTLQSMCVCVSVHTFCNRIDLCECSKVNSIQWENIVWTNNNNINFFFLFNFFYFFSFVFKSLTIKSNSNRLLVSIHLNELSTFLFDTLKFDSNIKNESREKWHWELITKSICAEIFVNMQLFFKYISFHYWISFENTQNYHQIIKLIDAVKYQNHSTFLLWHTHKKHFKRENHLKHFKLI